MNIALKNCNNIENAQISITEGALNVKYAINGTGKSTLAKAISAKVTGNNDELQSLLPYQHYGHAGDHQPSVEGIEGIGSVMTFNESYVDQYVYQPDEVIKDSFSIFVKTPDYDAHMNEIAVLLKEVNDTFQNHPELDQLIQVFTQFIEGFGKAKSGYSASGAIGKSLGKGNKIQNIPLGLEPYTPYLQRSEDSTNVKWLKWQLAGKDYLELADQCPYCSGPIDTTKDTILRVSEEYNAKSIEHLNKMLEVFDSLIPYFDDDTAEKIRKIENNVTGIEKPQQNYLVEVKSQIETFLHQLNGLKRVGFHSLKNVHKIADELSKYVIDMSYYSHLSSPMTTEKVDVINATLNAVLLKAGQLQGEVAKQNILIKKTIEKNNQAINDFLECAGYKYTVSIEEGEDQVYRMLLKPSDIDITVSSLKQRLSYGERNALALALFMFSALKENPDLVILDDPISSFDGNKKFAIINMLFMSKKCLRNRTVLLLTHEFNTVIDVIHTMPQNFNPAPCASFLTVKNGILSEKEIRKRDIQSYRAVAYANIASPDIDNLNKMVFLRRVLDVDRNTLLAESCEPAYQLLSNLFKKRESPIFRENGVDRPMTDSEFADANYYITRLIPDFDYNTEYQKTQDAQTLIQIYRDSNSNYEKLQIYRILYNENSDNPVVKKFVNETFHAENDLLFQLNPREYDTVPQYIIDECDRDIQSQYSQFATAG